MADGNATVTINGQTLMHFLGYLRDFLFSPSGRGAREGTLRGERNRLLLARLFTRPANVLVLDEPTNDLDTETLELLESLLVEFGQGTRTAGQPRPRIPQRRRHEPARLRRRRVGPGITSADMRTGTGSGAMPKRRQRQHPGAPRRSLRRERGNDPRR